MPKGFALDKQFVVARDEARKAGHTHFRGHVCDRGHAPERFVANGRCVACAAETHQRRRAKAEERRSGEWAIEIARRNAISSARACDAPTWDHRRAIEIGAAGEHLVCADLLLGGYRAFLATQGAPYDIAVDVGARLIRIAVKSTLRPKRRAGREGAREVYIFSVARSKRDNKGKTTQRAYSVSDVDIVALVTLDTRKIAYVPMWKCPTGINFDAPNGALAITRFGWKNYQMRLMEDFPFTLSLSELDPTNG